MERVANAVFPLSLSADDEEKEVKVLNEGASFSSSSSSCLEWVQRISTTK